VRPTVANMDRVSFEEEETFGAGLQVAAMATVVWTARIGFFLNIVETIFANLTSLEMLEKKKFARLQTCCWALKCQKDVFGMYNVEKSLSG
jgi:hypothetical protein